MRTFCNVYDLKIQVDIRKREIIDAVDVDIDKLRHKLTCYMNRNDLPNIPAFLNIHMILIKLFRLFFQSNWPLKNILYIAPDNVYTSHRIWGKL